MFIIQQNNNIAALPQEEVLENAQESYNAQLSIPPITTKSQPAPLAKSGITLIKSPWREPENKILPAQPEKDIEIFTDVSSKYNSSNAETQKNTKTGITIIGKHPTAKEVKEMNSAGVVMY